MSGYGAPSPPNHYPQRYPHPPQSLTRSNSSSHPPRPHPHSHSHSHAHSSAHSPHSMPQYPSNPDLYASHSPHHPHPHPPAAAAPPPPPPAGPTGPAGPAGPAARTPTTPYLPPAATTHPASAASSTPAPHVYELQPPSQTRTPHAHAHAHAHSLPPLSVPPHPQQQQQQQHTPREYRPVLAQSASPPVPVSVPVPASVPPPPSTAAATPPAHHSPYSYAAYPASTQQQHHQHHHPVTAAPRHQQIPPQEIYGAMSHAHPVRDGLDADRRGHEFAAAGMSANASANSSMPPPQAAVPAGLHEREREREEKKPPRRDPMSFASILSTPAEEPASRRRSSPPPPPPPPPQSQPPPTFAQPLPPPSAAPRSLEPMSVPPPIQPAPQTIAPAPPPPPPPAPVVAPVTPADSARMTPLSIEQEKPAERNKPERAKRPSKRKSGAAGGRSAKSMPNVAPAPPAPAADPYAAGPLPERTGAQGPAIAPMPAPMAPPAHVYADRIKPASTELQSKPPAQQAVPTSLPGLKEDDFDRDATPPAPTQHHLSTEDLLQYNLHGKGLEQEFFNFIQRRKRKAEETDARELERRVKRRGYYLDHICSVLEKQVLAGAARFNRAHEPEVLAEVQAKEVRDEKERKKEMQRKRRRENAMRLETQKLNEAQKKLDREGDEAEKEKLMREVERARRKIKTTQRAIDRSNEPGQEEQAEKEGESPEAQVPAASKEEKAGTTGAFSSKKAGSPAEEHGKPEKPERAPRRRATAAEKAEKASRGGARPKKSKEKKQAEKEAAEAAYAAMEKDASGNVIELAPKEEGKEKLTRKEARAQKARDKEREKEAKEKEKEAREKEKKEAQEKEKERKKEEEAKAKEEATPQPPAQPTSTLDSKGYNQIYEQIWRDIARKDIPKVFRIKTMSLNTRQDNLRKTAQLASKQSRKWQERTNKTVKDTQSRAKRTMREMMSFWKRNEREERDLRRLAEKQELELAKKAEADREANRQKRKLNFLISQTELYSHFIGRKIKTSEVEAEHAGGGVEPVAEDRTAVQAEVNEKPVVPSERMTSKVTNFDELDFDAIDDETLREAAMANAQSAVQAAQERARAFNEGQKVAAEAEAANAAEQMAAMDEGELNFQNPTSFGDVEVSQPKMLTAQLKEYQLKGLNWLVNLYEQGINGILADEMGLGKTVQSISVMAYLAEVHNIWGPFLVIAPASTLHNWQQEISKFVPPIKVLPYWGSAKDRKVLRKFWDRKHITYTKDSEFHVLVTSYQLVVLDAQYFQKVKWQYMILDEAQAIKSSQSSRWKNLLGFHCRNRLLLTGTPIQNNMQELWALLHFIMPTLFDSHDEFSEWFSKDIESHAQSNTKLNEDQLRRLHMILKPFMLRRVKKHVQKELGDKVEVDVFCDLTYRQRAYYTNLRNRVSILDLIEKATTGDDSDSTTLMNLVMQFRKVCNHPDLFERAETRSPLSLAYFAETASFIREGQFVEVGYSTRNAVDYPVPKMLCSDEGRVDVPGHANPRAGFEDKYLENLMNVWSPENARRDLLSETDNAFAWTRFAGVSLGEAYDASRSGVFERALKRRNQPNIHSRFKVAYNKGDEDKSIPIPKHSMLNIVQDNDLHELAEVTEEGYMSGLLNVWRSAFDDSGLSLVEPCYKSGASAPPIMLETPGSCVAGLDNARDFFSPAVRMALFGGVPAGQATTRLEEDMLEKKFDPRLGVWQAMNPPIRGLLPEPNKLKGRYTDITVPSMRRFVTDSGKLAKLDELLRELKNGGHRVLLYFQMTRMIDLMEEYLTYRNYKYCRLDGSTKLEDRRDTVLDFQQRPEIFVFLLSTRAGGLGINLTAADTVIFYDSDWNPTIDSQAMDRAHRLGQTKQVTVYRLITRGTIEERIRKRALQKEEVQRVVISGGAGGGVDFNTRSRENRTKDIAMWLADDEEAELIEQREKEAQQQRDEEMNGAGSAKRGRKSGGARKPTKKELSLEDLYHEGEGHFDDASKQASGTGTPAEMESANGGGGNGAQQGRKRPNNANQRSKKAKTMKERLQFVGGE